MPVFYGDFHVHLGRSGDGRPIKITAARNLTLETVLWEAQYRKGIDIVGVVDAAAPGVVADLTALIDRGELRELAGGGFCFREKTVLLPGAELETREKRGFAHFVAFLPTLDALRSFSRQLPEWVTNPNLSSQLCRCRAADILECVTDLAGILIPAHAFTPHKGLLGQGVDQLTEAFTDRQLAQLPAMELGLSADSLMADEIPGLKQFAYLSNSDAHSVQKIAREYNVLHLAEPNFTEFKRALCRENQRGIVANYGLDPRLGKYYRSACGTCGLVTTAAPPYFGPCAGCGNTHLTPGVWDRIKWLAIRYRGEVSCDNLHRPPYIHQVPLDFLPGVGTKTREKLLEIFGTEMNLLHRVTDAEIQAAVKPQLAATLLAMRQGTLTVLPGGGGRYGRVKVCPSPFTHTVD
ncbi:MAG: endonuclease Q family protein [Heliobacteriaceae bacterium]|nr:endonuclease Q family protein [Heliobacteriaceae bacterium]MDD4587290.1 endonuclease Q family protein [Heliobacteriaceae bacterium]